MNPVFWILVLLGGIFLWFLLTFLFVPIGRMAIRKWKKTMKILSDEDGEEEEEEQNE